jgi:branched-chain amino acid transport system permease protein
MITGGIAAEPADKPGAPGISLLVGIAVLAVLVESTQLREQLFLGALIAIQAYGLQFAWRYCGVFSMAYTAMSGVGAYLSVLLALHANMPLWVGILIAIPGAVVLGLVVSLVGLRASGMHFVIITYALAAALEIVADNWTSVTGGTSGLTIVKPLDLGIVSFGANEELAAFFVMYVLLLLSILAVVLPRMTRTGKRLVAGRDNGPLARAVGIPVTTQTIVALSLSGVIASAAGAVYAFHEFNIEPSLFGATASLQVLVVLVLGGLTRWSGPILGAAFTTLVPQYLGLSPIYTQIAYGVLLIAVVILFPEGLAGIASRASAFARANVRKRRRALRASGEAPTGPPQAASLAVTSPDRVTEEAQDG